MFRIDHPTAAGIVPVPGAAGTPGYFTNGNPGTSTPATVVDADWLNMVQEELMNIVAAAVITPSKTTRNQVLAAINALIAGATGAGAIQAQAGNYVAAGGTANAITATFTPAVGAHVTGMPLRIKIATTNTGATTLNPGPGVKDVRDYAGQPLVGGELVAGAIAEFNYDGTNYQHNQPIGRLIKREVFTASGTWTKDARARTVIAKVQAPGGGGGGVSTGGNYAGAAGGSAGSYGEISLLASALAGTVAVTVGTGGAGGSATGPANGSNGSAASSFGAHLSCAAGLGGTAMANGTSTADAAGGASPALPGTGDVKVVGQAGGFGSRENWSASAFGAVGGDGGHSFLGRGGKAPHSTASALAGVAGTGYGAGGSGAVTNSANGAAGGAGTDGIVIVETYA